MDALPRNCAAALLRGFAFIADPHFLDDSDALVAVLTDEDAGLLAIGRLGFPTVGENKTTVKWDGNRLDQLKT